MERLSAKPAALHWRSSRKAAGQGDRVKELERKLLERRLFATIAWAKQGTALQSWVRNHFEPLGLWSNMMYD